MSDTNTEKTIVAIDGPSGTGKSTTAKLLAAKLNFIYIDSGAMYRAVTYDMLTNAVKPDETEKIIELTKNAKIEFDNENFFLNGKEVSKEIRSIEVTARVSDVSAIKEVRTILVGKQREFSKEKDVVMDGRDIGTVVFPDAKFKFYLVCELKTRAVRRQQDFMDGGVKIPIDKIMLELQKRDKVDMSRKESPLRKAKDAIEVDTTNMIIEEQVNFLYRKIAGLE